MGDHYVPKFYLKGFTSGEHLWVHDRLRSTSFRSIPKSVANENEMYGQELEQQLANSVEDPAKPAIEKIRRGELPSSQERDVLAHYIIQLWKRVPKGRDRVAARMPEVAESVRNEFNEAFNALAEIGPEEAEQALLKRSKVDAVLDRYIENTPPDIWQGSLAKPGSGQPESVLLGMDWQFLTSRNSQFLTCDNPVFFFEHEGMGSPQAELTLPLSSKVCLWAHKLGSRQPHFYEARPAAIKAINRRIAYNATRFVFSAHQEDWILPFVQKGSMHNLSRLTF